MRRRRTHWPLALASGLLVLAATAAGGDAPDPAGTWHGSILFEEGRMELDLAARIARGSEGAWSVVLDLPPVGVLGHEVEQVKVAGDRVELRFDLGDGGGDRTIDVRLDPAGERMEGTFTHGLRTSPILLHRRPPGELRTAELQVLPGVDALRQRFRDDVGKVRLVLLLAPS